MIKLDDLISKYKSHEVDFVLPRDVGDTPLYLDLALLYESPDERWHKVQALIYEYFNFYLAKYRSGQILEKDLIDALKFPEVSYIALGYCKQGIDGSGGSEDRGIAIKREIFDDEKIKEIGIDAIAEMSIQIEGIGPDILSDMVANFAIHYLLDYTNEQVKTFDLKTSEYQIQRALDVTSMKWRPLLKVELPYFANGDPRLFVPKHLVRKLPIFSTTGFFRNFLRFILKQEQEDALIPIYKAIGKKPKVSFKVVKEELKTKYGSLGRATRIIAKERPELIKSYVRHPNLYASSKRKRRKKEVIDWKSYIKSLRNMPGGRENAKNYADLLRKIFTAIYNNKLVNGLLEQKSMDGIFYYDIDFANGANTPLFRVIRNQGIKGAILIIEAKNYKKTDIGNKEFNQSLSYTVLGGREIVFLISRDNVSEKDIERSRRYFLSHKSLILPLGDEDIISLIDNREGDSEEFDGFLIPKVQKILEA